METKQTKKGWKHILCREDTHSDVKMVQAHYRADTFDEALKILIENDAGVPFTMIKEMAEQGKTIGDLIALSKRLGK